MWVMNQDGLTAIEINAMAIDAAEILNNKNEGKIRVWGTTSNEHDYLLGVYNNIQDACSVIKEFAQVAAEGKTKLYQMPIAFSVTGGQA